MYVAHRLLKADHIEDRDYQRVLAERIAEAPHLIVLPTGLGKTVIALRAMLHYLELDPNKRILLLAPTKPLCDQHARFLGEALVDVAVTVLTGDKDPTRRDKAWKDSRVIVATPQVVQNDLVRGARDLADVSLLLFDEAHRAAGEYPYAFIARRYQAAGGRAAAGFTASPANDTGTLHRLLRSLGLEAVEIRTERDADVAPHVHEVQTEWIRVRPTHATLETLRLLERMYGRCVLALRRYGYFQNLRGLPSRKDLLTLGQRLRAEASGRDGRRSVFDAVSIQTRALKLQHAIELAETQGMPLLTAFLGRLRAEAADSAGSRAARDLVREPEFHAALQTSSGEAPLRTPKISRILDLVRDGLAGGHRRILVFANYRETADAIVAALSDVPAAHPSRFVGHARSAGEKGQSRREQQAIVERFRSGDVNVLVATAVGEEGLDLPENDAVILHEPVPSGIRFVQRRGRTGRRNDGRLYVLMTEGTRDESYHWSAMRRERKMREEMAALRRTPRLPIPVAPRPDTPAPPRPLLIPFEITMDPRESGSQLARILLERGLRIKTAPLPTGDFALSDRVLVERKTAADFVASLRDGRLFDQLPRLARAGVGILLVEGDPFQVGEGVSPQSLAGALAAAAADHRVSILPVPDAATAADVIVALLRREHREGRLGAARIDKAPRAPDAQLRFVLEGVPHVGPVTAQRLLERFGSIAAVAAATPDALAETPGIGLQTAERIRELLNRRYAAPASAPALPGGNGPIAALEGGQGPTG